MVPREETVRASTVPRAPSRLPPKRFPPGGLEPPEDNGLAARTSELRGIRYGGGVRAERRDRDHEGTSLLEKPATILHPRGIKPILERGDSNAGEQELPEGFVVEAVPHRSGGTVHRSQDAAFRQAFEFLVDLG